MRSLILSTAVLVGACGLLNGTASQAEAGLLHRGGGHSSCGGGHSSCGGGHSSCGGGHVSCGSGHVSCGSACAAPVSYSAPVSYCAPVSYSAPVSYCHPVSYSPAPSCSAPVYHHATYAPTVSSCAGPVSGCPTCR